MIAVYVDLTVLVRLDVLSAGKHGGEHAVKFLQRLDVGEEEALPDSQLDNRLLVGAVDCRGVSVVLAAADVYVFRHDTCGLCAKFTTRQ